MTQPLSMEFDQELARLKAEYSQRDSNTILAERYSPFNEATLLHAQSLERHLLALLKRHSFTDLCRKKILDVGCGAGGSLRRFLDYGAVPENLSGIDLMANRIEQARRLHPTIDWQQGSAHQLPYPDASFDLVSCSTVFSSIRSEQLRGEVANEMWRVRKPGGLMLFHDFVYSNPRNPAVQGITSRQVRQFFTRPGAEFDFQRLILAPPISRIVAPLSFWLAYTLEALKVFNTHIICIISQSKEKSQ
jgi:ubiquinone/menaquinone biosynthesis C-methylase UbiE